MTTTALTGPDDPVDYLQQTRDSYSALGFEPYRWAHNPEPSAMVAPTKPMSDSTVCLIASGGVYAHGQVAFTHKDDLSYRAVPTETPVDELRVTHFAFDQTNARRDPNVIFPSAALRSLVESGELGGVSSHALTFMGGIYSQRRFGETLIPALVDQVRQMAPDVVLLVPV